MQKKFIFVMMVCMLSMTTKAQEWVNFGSRAEGAPPELSMNRSDNQIVSFTVSLSGMYVESKNEDSDVYKRLNMSELGKTGDIGSPELPVFTKIIADPSCDAVQYSVTMSGVQTFTNYTVYPIV
jgi:hypothetical protein